MKSSLVVMLALRILPGVVTWPEFVSTFVVVFGIAVLWLRYQVRRRRSRWIKDRFYELEAYCRHEVKLPRHGGPAKVAEEARRVCRLVSEHSAYLRVALLVLNAEGRMACLASGGMDELALAALDVLGKRLLQEESAGAGMAPASFTIVLEEWEEFDTVSGCDEATIIPLRMHRGKLVGILAVCADAHMQRRINLIEKMEGMPRAAMPLEMLTAKLGRPFERERLAQRLMQQPVRLQRLMARGLMSW